ncbi:MAG: Gfo/Idh/MocA family oxidoreductase, partial [Candidatus Eisenbacteria bacterium]
FFAGRETPMIIHYTVNAGKIPLQHWVHDPVEGGGRMIGEACHFFDLFNFFTGSMPTELFTESIASDKRSLGTDENSITTVRFADGSVASLMYTALGNSSYPKERIEIFADGRVAVIDDFIGLLLRGNKSEEIRLKRQDKGHYNELVEFLGALRGEKHLSVSLEESVAATVCTLKALESLRTGTPQTITLL